jgi:heat shock protein HslJ
MRPRSLMIALPLVGVLVLVTIAGSIAFAARLPTERAGSGTPIVATGTTPTGTSHSLARGTWSMTRFVVDGAERLLVAPRVPTLQFRPWNGVIVGIGSCNAYSATYILDGDALRIGALAFTQALCVGPPGLMAQEDAYLHALPRVGRLSLSGDILILSSVDGRVQLTFRAA